jgi:hypothetical protein
MVVVNPVGGGGVLLTMAVTAGENPPLAYRAWIW